MRPKIRWRRQSWEYSCVPLSRVLCARKPALGLSNGGDFRQERRKPPCPTRNGGVTFARCDPAEQRIVRAIHTARREKTRETSSPTNPAHPAQRGRGRDQAPRPQSALEIPERATSRRTDGPSGDRKPRGRHSRYRSLQPYQTGRRCVSSSRTGRRRDTTPCSARRESAHAHGFRAQSPGGVPSQALLLAVRPILRRPNEHLHEVVVERVVKLALEAPLELRIVEVARMQIEIVGMDRDAFILELNDDFDPVILGTGREVQQRVLVQAKLREHALQTNR